MFAIGQASKQSGVNIETIRYYEREAVVPKPGRSAAGRRLYSLEEIAKLRFVKRCRDLGFPISIIKKLFSLSHEQGRSCHEVKVLAQDHLVFIDAKIDDLLQLRTALERLVNGCDVPSSSCPMLDTLMGDELSGLSAS